MIVRVGLSPGRFMMMLRAHLRTRRPARMRLPLLALTALLAGCGSTVTVERLASGASISGANGLQMGPDGLLYVASVIGDEIAVIDPADGTVVRHLTDGVSGPDDIDFAPDGAYYWTSILTGEVAGITADGDRVLAAKVGPGVNPITFSDDGRLFVAQCFFGSSLFEMDPAGARAPRVVRDDLGPGCGLNGMDWGPDGMLYGPRWFHGEVVRVNVDTGEMAVVASGLQVPAAVKFDPSGNLHVLDTGMGAILKISGSEQELVASLVPGLDNLAFAPDGRLFVTSFMDGFVAQVTDDGLRYLTPAGMAHPGGVTVRPLAAGGHELLVADIYTLRHFDTSGTEVALARNVLGVSELGSLLTVAMDGEDRVILTSWVDGDVRVWDLTEQRIVERREGLQGPVNAIRHAGSLVVAEHGSGRVMAYGGRLPHVIARDMAAPSGLVVMDGQLLVADRAEGTVMVVARG